MSRNTPQQLGKYRIDSLIGQGSMGVVYKGYDVDIARPVALKVLHRHLTDGDNSAEMAQRFKQEAQAAARCLHANIVTVFDYGIADDAQFIAMEFVSGTNLRTMLKYEQRLAARQAVDVIRQVLEALEYAHGNGVVHRDIKPANIMLTFQGRVKVTDFGIAKLDTSDLTSAGMVIGTPSYMSPEGRQGLAVDAKSDLYAAGLVLYEMLSGIRPVPNQDLIPTLKINLYEMVREQAAIDEVYALLTRVLAERPTERLGTAREFIRELDRIKLPEEEDTGENTLVRTLVNFQAKAPQAAPAEEPTGGARTGDFSPTVLEHLLRELKPFLGPMAERVVRRIADKSGNVDTLIRELAAQIPNDTERKQFVAKARVPEITGTGTGSGSGKAQGSSGGAASGTPPTQTLTLSADKLAGINQLLTSYVGPLATHITRRAMARSGTWQELGQVLIQHIPNEAERAAFLKKFEALA